MVENDESNFVVTPNWKSRGIDNSYDYYKYTIFTSTDFNEFTNPNMFIN